MHHNVESFIVSENIIDLKINIKVIIIDNKLLLLYILFIVSLQRDSAKMQTTNNETNFKF